MEKNKTAKYLKYAIGEVILVVIGILIALQINNWNTHRLDRISEKQFRNEIANNLKDDLIKIKSVRDFNREKDSAITVALKIMASSSPDSIRKKQIVRLFPLLTEYQVFLSNRVAFDNMTSSYNINLITNDSLRQLLSQYYEQTSSLNDFTQEQIKRQTRGFIDESITMLLDSYTVKLQTGLDMDIKQPHNFFNDPLTFKNLFNMRMNMIGQNNLLTHLKSQIEELLDYL